MCHISVLLKTTLLVLCIRNSFGESLGSPRNADDKKVESLAEKTENDVTDLQRKRRNEILDELGVQSEDDDRSIIRPMRSAIIDNLPSSEDDADMISGSARRSRHANDKLATEGGDQMEGTERNKRRCRPPWCWPPPRSSMRVAPNRYNYRSVARNPFRSWFSEEYDDDYMDGGLSYVRPGFRNTCWEPPCDPSLCAWETYKPVCCGTSFGYCNTYNNLCYCNKGIGLWFAHYGKCGPGGC